MLMQVSKLTQAKLAGHGLSLRAKSYLAYGILTVYAIFLSAYIFHQKGLLFEQFDKVQHAYDTETQLREADLKVQFAIEAQVATLRRIDLTHGIEHVHAHLALLQGMFEQMLAPRIASRPELLKLRAALQAAQAHPSQKTLAALQGVLQQLTAQIETRLANSSTYRHTLVEGFRENSNMAAMAGLGLGLFGLVLLGAVNGLFFTRLTSDLLTLKKRAEEIAEGRFSEGLPVMRHDEVGMLANAISRMSEELKEHNKVLALQRHKYLHQEKMAATGALAAGIAHEVGNPIAAISAIVQEVRMKVKTGRCPYVGEEDGCKLDLIQEHIERLRTTTREIAAFAQPSFEGTQLLDLNNLIRGTCRLIRYDKRFERVQVSLELDKQLPAIYGVGDQLTQVIMNLLVNAADALLEAKPETPTIIVTTSIQDEWVCMEVQDNGIGMTKESLAQAMQAFFTTKGTGEGTGLGLSLCNDIVTAHEGRIEIRSERGQGTKVNVYLPAFDHAKVNES